MAPRQEFCEGSIDVIRSLIHVSEQSLIRYGRAAGFGSPPECPQAQISQREQVKQFLKLFGHSRGQVRTNIWRAARRERNLELFQELWQHSALRTWNPQCNVAFIPYLLVVYFQE